MAITFQNREIEFVLKQKNKLRTWIKTVVESEKRVVGQLNFVFTNDDELLAINTQFLQHETYTDIITFDTCEGKTINGDIIISVERVEENAQKFKVQFEIELRRVIIHGVLHLLGFKDKKKRDVLEMRKMEEWALKKFMSEFKIQN
jgi:probable rRNA maturation factor